MTCDEARAVTIGNATKATLAATLAHYGSCDDCRAWGEKGKAESEKQLGHEKWEYVDRVVGIMIDHALADPESASIIREAYDVQE